MLARKLLKWFEDDEDGEKLAQFVKDVARQEKRMMFGLNFEDSNDGVSSPGLSDKQKSRRNSMDAILN